MLSLWFGRSFSPLKSGHANTTGCHFTNQYICNKPTVKLFGQERTFVPAAGKTHLQHRRVNERDCVGPYVTDDPEFSTKSGVTGWNMPMFNIP